MHLIVVHLIFQKIMKKYTITVVNKKGGNDNEK